MEKLIQQARGDGRRMHLALALSLIICTLILSGAVPRRDQRSCDCDVAVHIVRRSESGGGEAGRGVGGSSSSSGAGSSSGPAASEAAHAEHAPAAPRASVAGSSAGSLQQTRERGSGGGKDSTNQGSPATAGAAAGTAATSKGSTQLKHIYVVGCGHSGTSVLKRTIANLPGLLCLPPETNTYLDHAHNATEVQRRLRQWDAQARNASFAGWVEKTPQHVKHLPDIFRHDPDARVVFIVRDGRDVAASLVKRGWEFQQGLTRWVEDNTAALPYLDSSRLLTVKFEEFSASASVLRVLRQLSEFVRAPASPARLLLALQPPSNRLPDNDQCKAFSGEKQKVEDLMASYLQSLEALAGGSSGSDEEDEEEGSSVGDGGVLPPGKGPAPDRLNHVSFRSWQVSQAWAPHAPAWQRQLSREQVQEAEAHTPFQQLLQRFGYA